MKFTQNKKAFTLTELIIAITILIILSTIAFMSFGDSSSTNRDIQRQSDLKKINDALMYYKQQRGFLPLPGDSFNIINSGATVALQGKLNQDVYLSTLDSIPIDPYTEKPYTYSITKDRQQFQIAGTLENDDEEKSIVLGNYKSVSRNILPTIVLSVSKLAGEDVEINSGFIDGVENRKLFLFDNSDENLIYTLEGNYEPQSTTSSFDDSLTAAMSNNFKQDTNYYSCQEVYEAGKSIGAGEYQILNDDGELISIYCSMNFGTSTACITGEHSNGFSCVPDIESCPIQNGTGQRIWNYGTSSWEVCDVIACDAGYLEVGNICMAICIAGGVTPCVIQ